ncbi:MULTISPECIES: DUF4334 domain-containing protein [Gordonia]|jgi:hypothetical protein|uniref:DUF4334 domain-containing protein n=2 Tax=Gordonia terrae TaxID=2055 RepID=A0A2I1R1Y2_9ACTN|nr:MULTISPECIES: DUF4334 domain-containing protein [Gordonia]VTR02380.1 Uncharacterised protein [Clostridioides difficile]ANY23721.1 hypothetical protein BCM27_13790 [Gordonia terrae]AWO84456.1 DUF4334 domain-containing protein [Gordonia terrae]MCG7631027.1 DUF4334 domain-containing protein [Gordonia sp. McavH-238-E]PKZ63133.1 DUF4334 domain-containing protein [Gordonia terrae]
MHVREILPTTPTTTAEALDLFDSSPAVEPDFMIGTWRGAELPTDHPLDGFLAASGWWGKQFVDAETVHPLLFPTRDGSALWAMNPAIAFGGLGVAEKAPGVTSMSFATPIAATRLLSQTRRSRARLRTTRYRGTDTATMSYDQLPINDVFHRISDDAVLGAMDLKGSPKPYFFVLRRDDSLRLLGH